MIPEAAAEAVAVMIAEARCADVDRDAGYGDGENLTPDDYAIFMPSARENARIYLEAAAPHMLAGAWDAAYRHGVADERKAESAGRNFEPARTNPYRPTP